MLTPQEIYAMTPEERKEWCRSVGEPEWTAAFNLLCADREARLEYRENADDFRRMGVSEDDHAERVLLNRGLL